jgi:hypothetical protein
MSEKGRREVDDGKKGEGGRGKEAEAQARGGRCRKCNFLTVMRNKNTSRQYLIPPAPFHP